jgi:hypothetical protein
MNRQEAHTLFRAHKEQHEINGVYYPSVESYLPDEFKQNYGLAMDALPTLTTTANAGIPAMLTTFIDPQVYEILFAPNKAALIIGEERKGTWVDQTAMFITVESTGEISSYGDYNENGNAGANTNFPQRQSYLFQSMLEYGELELERAGLARINWVSQQQAATATVHNKFMNLTYLYGVVNLQNYGLLNDPNLTAALTPATKAAGGTGWANATANEIFNDIKALYTQLVSQVIGNVETTDKMVLALSPASAAAMLATNSFNVNVEDLIKKNFSNMRIEQVPQYGVLSASNSQGVAAGNTVQLIAETIEGQKVGFCAFNEKMRAHKLIPASSSYKQKQTGGSWGAVIRQPFAISQMVGV